MIDTIQLRLGMRNQTGEMIEHDTFNSVKNIIRCHYGNIKLSTYEDETYLKISYPRHYASSNVYLITSNKECLDFQREFVDTITRKVKEELQDKYSIEGIKRCLEKITLKLIRVDTPFTYRIPEEKEEEERTFSNYNSVFNLMFEAYEEKNKGNIKIYSDFNGNTEFDIDDFQSYIWSDTENIHAFNQKLQVYNQDARIRECYTLEEYKKIKKEYPDLPTRIRMEYIKRINRKEFTLEQFANFDLVCEYTLKFYTIILKEFFDEETIQKLKEKNINELSEMLKKARKRTDFSIRIFIYENKRLIKDYETLRIAIMTTSNNANSGYKLCTTARDILECLEKQTGRKSFKTFQALFTIAKELKNEIKKIRKMVAETKKGSKR